MAKKYRFRKMYFICEDKRVIEPPIEFTTSFRRKEYADTILKDQGERSYLYLWEKGPLPVKSVEGFYLVHESLFEEILKEYSKE